MGGFYPLALRPRLLCEEASSRRYLLSRGFAPRPLHMLQGISASVRLDHSVQLRCWRVFLHPSPFLPPLSCAQELAPHKKHSLRLRNDDFVGDKASWILCAVGVPRINPLCFVEGTSQPISLTRPIASRINYEHQTGPDSAEYSDGAGSNTLDLINGSLSATIPSNQDSH